MRVCIAGGGVVGLNIAYRLAGKGREIYLLEKERYLGHHTSTRNSEVIHAGFAYPQDSLKAEMCVSGNPLTYDLLSRLGVQYKRCGKWVIACGGSEEEALTAACKNAKRCGVPDFEYTDLERLRRSEPDICNVTKVIFSGTSGIMDAAGYIKALEVSLSNTAGVNLVYPCRIEAVDVAASEIKTTRGPIEYDLFINSAGLWADDIYDMTCDEDERGRYKIVPFKGEYYTWRRGRIGTMIYPVPSRFLNKGNADGTLVSSMGIHIHRNISGELFLGPSQIEKPHGTKDDYMIESPREIFVKAVSRYLRGVVAEDLEPAYAGNRPKLMKNGRPCGDFEIFRKGNIIHLLGIESPGLTAAPAIALHVEGLL